LRSQSTSLLRPVVDIAAAASVEQRTARALEVGKNLERRALLWIVLGKSLIFAILLIAFHIVEGAIRAWFESQPLSPDLTDFGGTLPALMTYAAIFCVVLIPFFRLPRDCSHPRQQRA
jgi:hypothetical protein